VTPTSVKVIVNPSQVQLLRGEIDRLNAKAQNIKEELRLKSPADRQALLLGGLNDAAAELATTEKTYKEQGKEPSYIPAIDMFFGDIKLTYDQAIKALTDSSVRAPQTGPRLKSVNAVLGSPSPRDLALGSIERNIKAYALAVSNKAISFNLEVTSEPMGAQIFYKRDDEDFQRWGHDTNATLYNLIRAAYTIRLQLDGYVTQDRPFDANKDPSTSINIPLDRKTGAR
jgi:hypothetical protein